MQKLTQEDFITLLSQTSIKPRLKNELKFVTSTQDMTDEEWTVRELLAISDRNNRTGVLIVCLDNSLYIAPYELRTGIASALTGKAQSVVCDFCLTWQYGNKSASINFTKSRNSTVSFLCCADLQCSLHVRNKTPASKTSRAQLREDMTVDGRIKRLGSRLKEHLSDLPFEKVTL